MNMQKIQNSQTMLKQNEVAGLALSTFKTYWRVTVNADKHAVQQKRLNSSELDPHIMVS